MKNQDPTQASPEQLIYAGILEKGMLIGLLLMFITFGLYVSGIMKPAIPRAMISQYWSLPVATATHHAAAGEHGEMAAAEEEVQLGYLDTINQNHLHLDKPPLGWAWLKLINKGDFLNFIPVAILAGVTILCFLSIVPTLLAKKDMAYTVMSLLEVVILAAAASGLLAVGH